MKSIEIINNPLNELFAFRFCLQTCDLKLTAWHVCVLCQNNVFLSQLVQVETAVQKLVYLWFTIFWEARNSRNSNTRFWQFIQKIRLWFCTCRYIFFQSKQLIILFTKIIFAHPDWKQLHNKITFINCFKAWAKPRTYIFLRQNIISLILTWIDGCPQKYLKIIFH